MSSSVIADAPAMATAHVWVADRPASVWADAPETSTVPACAAEIPASVVDDAPDISPPPLPMFHGAPKNPNKDCATD
jgi:hypothetical protein